VSGDKAQDPAPRLAEIEIRLCFLEERLEALAGEQIALMRTCEQLGRRLARLERLSERDRGGEDRSGQDGR
jgi:uncharacterized coiled-coil protein SlyX